MLCGPQKRSRRFGVKRIIFPLLGIEPIFVGCPVHGHYEKYNNSVSTVSEAAAVFFSETSEINYDIAWRSDQENIV